MDMIRVWVVQYKNCRNLMLRYKDPLTGKCVNRTSYHNPMTGEETKTGENRKFAEKLATLWEADLNNGLDQGRNAISWQQFRLRYEDEVLPSFAKNSAQKINTIFDAVERILPRVATGRLADLDARTLSVFQSELRDGKRAETTIGSYLAHLKAALSWAYDQGMIYRVPKIKRPQRAKKGGRGRRTKGRPITAEEFDRLKEKIPTSLGDWRGLKREIDRQTRRNKGINVRKTSVDSIPIEVSPAAVESWRHYMTGLWLSGLRLTESLQLYWDRPDRLCVELESRRPMLRIPAEYEKGHRDRLLPITPDFAEFLLQTPESDRRGRVFRPLMPSGNSASSHQAGRMLALIGELARVVVYTNPRTGKIKHASAHDLRRSFGNRWAKRVMPAVLQRLMRHESIETTMGYYVDLDANELAEDLYRAYNEEGKTLGKTLNSKQDSPPAKISLTSCTASNLRK